MFVANGNGDIVRCIREGLEIAGLHCTIFLCAIAIEIDEIVVLYFGYRGSFCELRGEGGGVVVPGTGGTGPEGYFYVSLQAGVVFEDEHEILRPALDDGGVDD